MNTSTNRRQFIGKLSLAGAALASSPFAFAQTATVRELKVALIGCGGRGRGALRDFIAACKLLNLRAKLVATADAFKDRAEACGKQYGLDPARCFGGYESYRAALATDCEFVLLAAPPGFRPPHFVAAVEAGKHVFMEKPVAVDPVGARVVIDTGKMAAVKGLGVVAGTQRRHQKSYLENKARIDAGAIGEIRGGVVQWNSRIPWIKKREAKWSDAEYMTRNWLNFTELSGDHIVEQHVHNIDVAIWFLGRLPVSAIGFGGRARRETGNQFDFFSVDLDFGDGVHINSQCRQLKGAYGRVGETFTGTTGWTSGGGKMSGKEVAFAPVKVESENPYVQEHVDLIKGVLADKPVNEAQQVAESTLVAIMGRISAYTGQLVRWTDVTANQKSPFFDYSCSPAAVDFEKGKVRLPKEVAPTPGQA